jgi:hypothetical protein
VRLDRSERPAHRALRASVVRSECRALRVSVENRARPDLQDPRVRLDRSERPVHPAHLALRVSVARSECRAIGVSPENRAQPVLQDQPDLLISGLSK